MEDHGKSKIPRHALTETVRRKLIEMKAQFVPPDSIAEGRAQLTTMSAEAEMLIAELRGKTDDLFPSVTDFREWKGKASVAYGCINARRILLKEWLQTEKEIQDRKEKEEKKAERERQGVEKQTQQQPEPAEVVQYNVSFEAPELDFETPKSVDEAEEQLTALTSSVLMMEQELTNIRMSAFPKAQKDAMRDAVLIPLRARQAKRRLLHQWVLTERKRLDQQAQARRSEVLGADDNESLTLILQAYQLLESLRKNHHIYLADEDQEVVVNLRTYLQRNGCII